MKLCSSKGNNSVVNIINKKNKWVGSLD